MRTPVKYVIFDFDGVLVDSEFIAASVAVQLKSELGIVEPIEEHIAKFSGLAQSHPDFQEELKRLPADYLQTFRKRVREAFTRDLTPLGSAIEFLDKMVLPKCIASGSEPESLAFKLDHTGLRRYFGQHAFSSRQVPRGKPFPDLFLFAADTMGWNAPDGLVIEDSVPGVKAGRAAGMTVCGFTGGRHCPPDHRERLQEAGAHQVVSDLREIFKLFPETVGGAGS